MFTGIIEEIGTIDRIQRGAKSASLRIKCSTVLGGTKIGDSIAVSGVCLTVTGLGSDWFEADAMDETVRRSSLSHMKSGDKVNLERAMAADGRFGGHIVAGHVDTTGIVGSVVKEEMAVVYRIELGDGSIRNDVKKARTMGNGAIWGSSEDGAEKSMRIHIKDKGNILRYIVEKGSITIDGISLTVASVDETGFAVSVIPHTMAQTTLADRKPGDIVNLETDIIGKYVEKLMASGRDGLFDGYPTGNVGNILRGDFEKGQEFLRQNGF